MLTNRCSFYIPGSPSAEVIFSDLPMRPMDKQMGQFYYLDCWSGPSWANYSSLDSPLVWCLFPKGRYTLPRFSWKYQCELMAFLFIRAFCGEQRYLPIWVGVSSGPRYIQHSLLLHHSSYNHGCPLWTYGIYCQAEGKFYVICIIMPFPQFFSETKPLLGF